MNLLEKINSLPEEKQEALKKRIETDGDSYGVYRLTGTQYGIWCAYEIDSLGKNSFYNICSKLIIQNNVNKDKAKEAVNDVFNKHEALKYKFISLGENVYQYVDKDAKASIDEEDISKLSSLEKEKYLKKLENDMHFYHFDLQKENPIKFKIIKTEEDSLTIYFCIHHIVCDGWSLGVLINSYLEAYFDMKDKKETCGFSKYIINNKSKKILEEQNSNLNYWVDKLKDSSEILPLPTNEINHENNTKGKYIEMPFSKELENKVDKFSKTYKFSLQSIVLSAFTIVMQRYCNVSKLNVGMTMARRSYEYTRNMIGDIASMVVIPLKVNEKENSLNVIKSINLSLLDGIEHENIVFSDLINNAATERIDGIEPLYQLTFAVHSNKLSKGLVDGELLEINNSKCMYKYLPSEDTEGFNGYLCVTVQEKENGINIQAEYSTKYFTCIRVKTILNSILNVLNKMVDSPEDKINTINTLNENRLCNFNEIIKEPLVDKLLIEKIKMNSLNNQVLILDNNLNIVPNGFPGEIYYKKDCKLVNSGKYGYIEENDLHVLEQYSRIAEYNQDLIDVCNIKENLINKYKVNDALVYVYNESILVIIYSNDELLYEEDIKKLVNFNSLILIKTSIDVENKRYFANKIAQSYLKLKAFSHVKRQAYIEKNDNKYLIYETDNNEKLSFNDVSLIKRYGGCNNLKIGYYENIPVSNAGIVTKKINTDLIIFPKADNLSEVEEKVKNIWNEILGHDNYTIYDKFYEIGGNSIMMINMHRKINKEFDININIAELFIYNTVFDLAKYIETEYLAVNDENSLKGMKF